MHFRYKLLSQAKGFTGFENQLIFLYSGQAVISYKVPCNLKVRMLRLKLTFPSGSQIIICLSNLYWCSQLSSRKYDECLSFKGLWLKLIQVSPGLSFHFRSNTQLACIDLAAFSSHSIILHMFTGFMCNSPCLILVSLLSSYSSHQLSTHQLHSVNSCYNEYSILSVLSSVYMWPGISFDFQNKLKFQNPNNFQPDQNITEFKPPRTLWYSI